MESVFQKLFIHKNGRKSSKQFGLFCRKSRNTQAPTVIELPAKDGVKTRHHDDAAIVVSLPPPDVRLILFQECGETSDRKLLFDSKSFEPEIKVTTEENFSMNQPQHGQFNNNSKCHLNTARSYQYVRGPQDSGILSEMLFGTPGMASRASSLKIHIMKKPQRLMLSRVFCVESAKETVSLDRGIDCQRPAIPLSRRKAKTLPVPTPEPTYIPPPIPQSFASSLTSRITRSDSSSSLMSLTSILGASLGATGSLGSRSIPQQIPSNRAHSLPPATRQASRDSFTLNKEPYHGVTSRRTKVKIGFAVIFQPEPSTSSEFQRYFFEHFPLIESYLTFLKEQVESALNNFKRSRNQEFIEAMMEALYVFTLRLNSVYSTPRLLKPVWSSLTTVTSQGFPWLGDDITMKCFIADLARMVTQHNTKNKNFFMSGLITSVLTHHLGWVNTTMPPSGENNSPSVAYNPLWAQLGDIYGAVGTPTKVAKTLVIGEIHELVSTIISILSYFIRCSNVSEVVEVPSDLTPQAFLEAHSKLKMTYVPSALEIDDYVFVSAGSTKSLELDLENEANKAAPSPEKMRKFSFCRKKNKSSEPISVKKPDVDSSAPSSASTLCRSRSSPGTVGKPQIRAVIRQKSSGNFENLPTMRVRTNSNDAFARPRGVQSRRTSYEVANLQRMSQSSSALVIPDSEKSDNTVVSSLEGSKSLCLAPTPTTDLLRKRLGNDNMGSCPHNMENEKNTTSVTSGQQRVHTPSPMAPKPRTRTHKRVSSEPFNVNQLRPDVGMTSSLVKTNSTYFPRVRQTFVETIEPKIVNVAHVQRSQHVIAMQSPVSSPLLPRSKSSVTHKGPIFGFKTNQADEVSKLRFKHKSGSSIQEKVETVEFRDVFPLQNGAGLSDLGNVPNDPENSGSKFTFNDAGVQRSSSNLSTNSAVRRSSSANSAKVKLAVRRRRLTDSSKNSSFDDESEKTSKLPPLGRIPSVSLEHEEFDQYFKGGEACEYISFSTEKSPGGSENHSTMTQNQSSGTKPMNQKCQSARNEPNANKRSPPPLPSVGPRHQVQSTVSEIQPSVAESVSLKAENHSTRTKTRPPLIPSVGPCHRSQSTKANTVSNLCPSPIIAPPKSAPPLPTAPPVHKGPLYPSLDEKNMENDHNPLPKSSIYPSLDENSHSKSNNATIYPKLDETPNFETGSTLYPKLPAPSCDQTLRSCLRTQQPTIHESKSSEDLLSEENAASVNNSEGAEYFSTLEEIPLRPVEFSEKVKQQERDENKPSRLTFGELLADYSPDYLWGFALHGTRNQSSLYTNVIRELQHSVQRPVLDEPVAEAVSIVADTDKWTVKVLSSHRIHSDKIALNALNSKLVTNILERITKLYQMSVPAYFCLQQLESSLGELVLKSRMLAGYVKGNKRVKMSQLSAVLGIESSDLPLLMSIASCHSPQVAAIL